ncbi:MAG: HIT domain-containing protein [Desulfurivibrio sp.]|nr:HIT domain-containing protein [Desulfurivibrio sp.]MBU3936003.1 HIT domain-containing protein [Pseudomonadota bacterium]MBU4033792.1 HIT domain-containing protein [Pseudomonadota bacterium]
MKTLWTPWRMAYIEDKGGTKDCFFCASPDLTHSIEDLILYRDGLLVVLMNRFPYANGHLLVAPARHVADIEALSIEENNGLSAMLTRCTSILRRHLQPDGFNIGLNLGEVAGAGIASHLHWHIVPRWHGDHNYMTILAEVRTIPEHINNTFARLLPDFHPS